MKSVPLPTDQDAIASVPQGFVLGFVLPGLAQMIAQRPCEGIFWLAAVIAAWIHGWPLGMLLHALSALRMIGIMTQASRVVMQARGQAQADSAAPVPAQKR